MANQFLDRVGTVAAGLLKGEHVEVAAKGEDYYVVEVLGADGRKSNFPAIWLSGSLSDREIHDKLEREFEQHLHPDSAPDDASLPNIRTEGLRATHRRTNR